MPTRTELIRIRNEKDTNLCAGSAQISAAGAGIGKANARTSPLFPAPTRRQGGFFSLRISISVGIADTKDKARYLRRNVEILDRIAKQARDILNATREPECVTAIFESEAFAILFDQVLTRWDDIRSAKGYVAAALQKLLCLR
jgi:ribosomal protein L17